MTSVTRGIIAVAFATTALSVPAGAARAATTPSANVPATTVTVTTQSAIVSCVARPTSAYFARWGDINQYFLAPGGEFQVAGTHPWSGSGGAATVAGGDPWDVTGAAHPSAANIPPGGTEKSPSFCVTPNENTLRFFYHSPGVPGSVLKVTINATSGLGVASTTAAISGSTPAWGVTNVVKLPAIYDPSGQEYVTITFSTANAPGSWQVDNVMVDPFTPLWIGQTVTL